MYISISDNIFVKVAFHCKKDCSALETGQTLACESAEFGCRVFDYTMERLNC